MSELCDGSLLAAAAALPLVMQRKAISAICNAGMACRHHPAVWGVIRQRLAAAVLQVSWLHVQGTAAGPCNCSLASTIAQDATCSLGMELAVEVQEELPIKVWSDVFGGASNSGQSPTSQLYILPVVNFTLANRPPAGPVGRDPTASRRQRFHCRKIAELVAGCWVWCCAGPGPGHG